MGDPNVERWRQQGIIAMWIVKRRSWAEWNITADDVACDAMIELLDLMENGRWSSKKEIILTKPMHTPDGGDYPIRSATRLTIRYLKERVPENHWALSERDRELRLELGKGRLQELRNAIADMKADGGDYAIGSEQAPPLDLVVA